MSHAVDSASANFLGFTVGDNHYGITLEVIAEVTFMVAYAALPPKRQKKQLSAIIGLIDVRGRVLPLLSIRKIFSMEEVPFTRATRILLLHLDSVYCGLIVDSVTEIITPQLHELKGIDTGSFSREHEFVDAIYHSKDNIVLIIDLEKLLNEEEIRLIQEFNKET